MPDTIELTELHKRQILSAAIAALHAIEESENLLGHTSVDDKESTDLWDDARKVKYHAQRLIDTLTR